MIKHTDWTRSIETQLEMYKRRDGSYVLRQTGRKYWIAAVKLTGEGAETLGYWVVARSRRGGVRYWTERKYRTPLGAQLAVEKQLPLDEEVASG